MRGRARSLLAAALACLALSSAPAAAQQLPGRLAGTPAEDDAYHLLDQEQFLSARTRADEVLAQNPRSIIGHYVLGVALLEAEGSLPRAMRHLKRARELYEQTYGLRGSGKPWRTHREILFQLQYCALLIEDFEMQLSVLRAHDELYTPKLVAHYAWPLMKLGRYDDAMRSIEKAQASEDARFFQGRILNSRCVVEGDAQHRRASHEACLAVLDYGRKRLAESRETDPKKRPGIAVYANNAFLSALSVLRHDEAEKIALEGVSHLEIGGSNPWMQLARLYLLEARPAEALSAIKHMNSWRAHQPPDQREQHRADSDATIALLFLAAGEAEQGLTMIDRSIERPDRRGMISTHPEQSLGAHALTRRALLRQRAELDREAAVAGSLRERLTAWGKSIGARSLAVKDSERVANILADPRILQATMRVYLDGGIEYAPTWLLGDLVDVLGPGVVLASLARARRDETEVPEYTAFYDAIEAEAQLLRGQHAKATELARKALAALPRAEAMLASRVAAVGAEAALRDGRLGDALELFQRSWEIDPGTLRRLGLALPVRFQIDGSAAVLTEAADALRRSPRLDERKGGFVVRLSTEGNVASACLLTPLGNTLACGKAIPDKGDEAPVARKLVADFHRAAFGLRAQLAGMDIRSLDGSTTVTEMGRQKLIDMIKAVGP